jgi:phosphopantothenoylcysteine decarboxylase/phosphopantothenate--cysteine ligase
MSKQVLILSGPTHEYIDPVRFIGNSSSGLMGKAIAEEAIKQGYTVQFVTGPVAPSNLPDLGNEGRMVQVTSADEMMAQAAVLFPDAQVAIFAAAVADYAPIVIHTEKLAKSESDLVLNLRATPDVAKTLCEYKREDQVSIGFALQTHDGEANALRKLKIKNLDGIVLNTPSTLGAEEGIFSFITSSSDHFEEWGCISKPDCAKRIFQQVEIINHGK